MEQKQAGTANATQKDPVDLKQGPACCEVTVLTTAVPSHERSQWIIWVSASRWGYCTEHKTTVTLWVGVCVWGGGAVTFFVCVKNDPAGKIVHFFLAVVLGKKICNYSSQFRITRSPNTYLFGLWEKPVRKACRLLVGTQKKPNQSAGWSLKMPEAPQNFALLNKLQR